MGCSHVTNCTVLPSPVTLSRLDCKNVEKFEVQTLFLVGPNDWLLKVFCQSFIILYGVNDNLELAYENKISDSSKYIS